jgi:hypothetical protein
VLHRTCSTLGCDDKHHARGLCETHYQRARDGANTSYQAVHLALNTQRGRARNHVCVDCGGPAREWSYDYNDPDEIRSESGTRYSLDIDRYQPRCVSCHRTRDHQERAEELRASAPNCFGWLTVDRATFRSRGGGRRRLNRAAAR